MNSPNVLNMMIQQALKHSHPSPLPANEPIIIPAGAYGGAALGDSVATTVTDLTAMTWGNFKWGQFQWQ